ncbi:uncharacterized protein METZ01_LOCUS411524, partial [marine metagenome]
MNNDAVEISLTDEDLEELHQAALDAVLSRSGKIYEMKAPEAAGAAMEKLLEKVEAGHPVGDRVACVEKWALDWIDGHVNLTSSDLEDLHRVATKSARSVGGPLAESVADDAANTALARMVTRIYDGFEVKHRRAYVSKAAHRWTLNYINDVKNFPKP